MPTCLAVTPRTSKVLPMGFTLHWNTIVEAKLRKARFQHLIIIHNMYIYIYIDIYIYIYIYIYIGISLTQLV